MAQGEGSVRVEREGDRATVVWDRPPAQVFDRALLQSLAGSLGSDPVRTAKVVVLKGARQRWSAGFAVEDHLSDRVPAMLTAFRQLLTALWSIPGPVVAQVEGLCLGGGLELVAACDLAYASASASFGQPEIRLGVFPPLGVALYGQTLGPKRAAELLFLGETIPAARAEAIGLVGRVVADGEMEGTIARVADQLTRLRQGSLVLLKKALSRSGPAPWDRLDQAEEIYLKELMALPGAEEGLRAFLEKRPPVWPTP